MTTFRLVTSCALITLMVLAVAPVRADTPAVQPTAGGYDDETVSGPGGLYRVMATSAGVLLGIGAMSLFIDGWVVDAFRRTSGMTAVEAIEVVHDLDSQGGLEAAAVLFSGLVGGMIADDLYGQAGGQVPGMFTAVRDAAAAPAGELGRAWTWSAGWVADRLGDASDWVQARSRELADRVQVWREQMAASGR